MTTVTVTPTITATMLRSRGACKEQRAIFEAEWPNGAEVTLQNVLRAVGLGLHLEWGQKLFSPTARAEYERQEAALWAEYHRQVVPLRAECDRQVALLRAEYQRQKAALWDECERQVALLRAEYNRQKAPIWLAAFLASQTS